ncbi:MAG: hypothetical protein AABY65_05000 [Nitrospirota bacterium]
MLNPDYKDILSAFSDEKVEFLLVGAFALAAHGLPRATGDIDLWIRRTSLNAKRVIRALQVFGAPLADVSEKDFLTPGLVFQIGVAPRRIDILTSIDGVDFDEAWPEREEVAVGGIRIPLISRKHLIRNKRAVGRPQDEADARRLEDRSEE